jgi:pimeloyl-ACP methyl ester carboxylesterase
VAPRIRFCQGAGGHRIAYAVDGEGPFLVLPAWWVSHVELDYADPAHHDLFDRLATRTTVVRYDRPGVGLSDRAAVDHTPEQELADLEALVDHLGADRVALLGLSCGGPLAVAYAAAHPDRTSHLVLYGAYCRGAALAPDEVRAAIVGLVRAHWGMGAKAFTDLFAPGLSPDDARRFAVTQRESASPEMAARLLELTYRWDVSEHVGRVQAPTLVMHRQKDRAISFEHGRELASIIPGATFVPLAGNAHVVWFGERDAFANAVLDFVAPARDVPPPIRADESVFVRRGEIWSIAFMGRTAHVKHARGLADIATLLSRPHEEVHAAVLMDGPSAAPVPRAGADEVLDDRALTEIRARLAALDEAIERAESAGDAAAALRADEEREALVATIRASTGLGGRRRKLGDPAERARKAVTARVRESIERLRLSLPELASHLDASIVTGTYCSYAPSTPVRWRT